MEAICILNRKPTLCRQKDVDYKVALLLNALFGFYMFVLISFNIYTFITLFYVIDLVYINFLFIT